MVAGYKGVTSSMAASSMSSSMASSEQKKYSLGYLLASYRRPIGAPGSSHYSFSLLLLLSVN